MADTQKAKPGTAGKKEARNTHLPHVITEEEFIPLLRRSFVEWEPDDDEDDREELLRKRDTAARSIAQSINSDLQSLLQAAVDDEQVAWAMKKAAVEAGTPYFACEWASDAYRRQRELWEEPTPARLDVTASADVVDVSLPEATVDELTIHLTTWSAAPKEPLLDFMKQNGLLPGVDRKEVSAKWEVEAAIGTTEEERVALEKCLSLRFELAVEERHTKITYYHASGFIGRECTSVVRLRLALDLSRFPFDESPLRFDVRPSDDFDPALCLALPESDGEEWVRRVEDAVPPRGFEISEWVPLVPTVYWDGGDVCPASNLWLGFTLRRLPQAFVWRTFIPAIVVLLFASVAALGVLFTGLGAESVMTSVFPAVLIACVALQWTAATSIPRNSGRTLMDEVFVSTYVYVMMLYVTVLLRPSAWSIAGGVGALAAAAYAVLRFLRHPRKAA